MKGRIPNFEGADRAAEQLRQLDVWQDARVLKANPDSPQRWPRRNALRSGKVLYMAVPRLRKEACFLELDPNRIPQAERASSLKGAFALGRPVHPERMRPVDLVLTGSVAVDGTGGRLGKGGGYSDLEYALGRTVGFLGEETPIVTTVHPLQIVPEAIPMLRHDIPVDFVATPQRLQALKPKHARPEGVFWDLLPEEKRTAIPILWRLRERGEAA